MSTMKGKSKGWSDSHTSSSSSSRPSHSSSFSAVVAAAAATTNAASASTTTPYTSTSIPSSSSSSSSASTSTSSASVNLAISLRDLELSLVTILVGNGPTELSQLEKTWPTQSQLSCRDFIWARPHLFRLEDQREETIVSLTINPLEIYNKLHAGIMKFVGEMGEQGASFQQLEALICRPEFGIGSPGRDQTDMFYICVGDKGIKDYLSNILLVRNDRYFAPVVPQVTLPVTVQVPPQPLAPPPTPAAAAAKVWGPPSRNKNQQAAAEDYKTPDLKKCILDFVSSGPTQGRSLEEVKAFLRDPKFSKIGTSTDCRALLDSYTDCIMRDPRTGLYKAMSLPSGFKRLVTKQTSASVPVSVAPTPSPPLSFATPHSSTVNSADVAHSSAQPQPQGSLQRNSSSSFDVEAIDRFIESASTDSHDKVSIDTLKRAVVAHVASKPTGRTYNELKDFIKDPQFGVAQMKDFIRLTGVDSIKAFLDTVLCTEIVQAKRDGPYKLVPASAKPPPVKAQAQSTMAKPAFPQPIGSSTSASNKAFSSTSSNSSNSGNSGNNSNNSNQFGNHSASVTAHLTHSISNLSSTNTNSSSSASSASSTNSTKMLLQMFKKEEPAVPSHSIAPPPSLVSTNSQSQAPLGLISSRSNDNIGSNMGHGNGNLFGSVLDLNDSSKFLFDDDDALLSIPSLSLASQSFWPETASQASGMSPVVPPGLLVGSSSFTSCSSSSLSSPGSNSSASPSLESGAGALSDWLSASIMALEKDKLNLTSEAQSPFSPVGAMNTMHANPNPNLNRPKAASAMLLNDWIPSIYQQGFPHDLVHSLVSALQNEGFVSVQDLLDAQNASQLDATYLKELGFKMGHSNRLLKALKDFSSS